MSSNVGAHFVKKSKIISPFNRCALIVPQPQRVHVGEVALLRSVSLSRASTGFLYTMYMLWNFYLNKDSVLSGKLQLHFPTHPKVKSVSISSKDTRSNSLPTPT